MTVEQHSQIWEISLITPLHVGDGESLNKDMDFVLTKNMLKVYHPESIYSALAEQPRAIEEVGRLGFDLARFFKDYRIAPPPQYCLPFKGDRAPDNVRRFIKNGYGLPYLAGTTLKGGIRTALWTNLNRSGLPTLDNFNMFKKGVKNVSGQDPHHDFLRPLKVGDSAPMIPEGALEALEIKWLNLNRENQGGWRDFTSRRTYPDDKQAGGIYVEALKPETRLYAAVSLSAFLTSAPIRRSQEIQPSPDLGGLNAVAAAVNRHSLEFADKEKAFFQKAGANASAAFYDTLRRRMREETDGFFLRIAWGGGWRAMTGDWLPEPDIKKLRDMGKLKGKPGVEIFPKTRRLAVKDSIPCLPLGWVKIRVAEPDAFERAMRAAASHEIPVTHQTGRSTAPAAVQAPLVDPAQLRQEKLAQFREVIAKEPNLPGSFQAHQAQITPLKDETLKREMCQILLAKAHSLPKPKKFSKALKDGKPWALQLKQLCETCGLDATGGQEGKA